MKTAPLIIATMLCGCTTTQLVVNTDSQCDKVAWYARATATLRDVGVPIEDIDKQTRLPAGYSVQMRYVREEVYTIKSKTPADIYAVFYGKCMTVGYDHMLAPIPPAPPRFFETGSPTIVVPYDSTTPTQQYPHHENPICYTNTGECPR